MQKIKRCAVLMHRFCAFILSVFLSDRKGVRALQKTRIAWLDIARSFAIFSVIVVHCTERIYSMDFDKLQTMGVFSPMFRNVLFTVGRIGVPLFLMITGYLLLDRDFSSSKKIFSFYKHNLLPLIVTAEMWILIYAARYFITGEGGYTVADMIGDMLFIRPHNMGHMWYVPLIIGFYIAVPFIANAIRNVSSKVLAVPVLLVFVTVFLFQFYGIFQNAFDLPFTVTRQVDVSFLGGTYGIYLIAGALCKRGVLKKIPTAVVLLISVASFAVMALFIFFMMRAGYDYHLWYDFPFLFLCAFCLFELFSRINTKRALVKKGIPVTAAISSVSFGMYFMHVPLLRDILKYFEAMDINNPLKTLIYIAVVFTVSLVLSFLLSKIPVVKRLLFNIKK